MSSLMEMLSNVTRGRLSLPWMPSERVRTPLDPVVLARDERAHDRDVEWWHFMGELRSIGVDPSRGRPRHLTFVASALKGRAVGISKLASVAIIIDHDDLSHIVSSAFGSESATYREPPDGRSFQLHFGPAGPARPGPPEAWSMSGGMGVYSVVLDVHEQVVLSLRQSEPVSLFGGDGSGVVRYPGGHELAYYAWPNLDVRGHIGVGAQELEVVGHAWMEHQWGDMPVGDYRWKYLAVVLDDGERWVFMSAHKHGEDARLVAGGRIAGGVLERWYDRGDIYVDGENGVEPDTDAEQTLDDARREQLGRLPLHRFDGYPVESRVAVFDKEHLEACFEVRPLFDEQECKTRLPRPFFPTFWEGACRVKATFGEREVSGWAITELAGYSG